MDFVREDDEFVVSRLDRLARSVLDLTSIAKELQSGDVGFVVLDQSIDTTNPTGNLLFHMLGAIGEFERELINERVRDGLAKAKKSGVLLGRRKKLSDASASQLQRDFMSARKKGIKELQTKYGIGKSTLYRYIKS